MAPNAAQNDDDDDDADNDNGERKRKTQRRFIVAALQTADGKRNHVLGGAKEVRN